MHTPFRCFPPNVSFWNRRGETADARFVDFTIRRKFDRRITPTPVEPTTMYVSSACRYLRRMWHEIIERRFSGCYRRTWLSFEMFDFQTVSRERHIRKRGNINVFKPIIRHRTSHENHCWPKDDDLNRLPKPSVVNHMFGGGETPNPRIDRRINWSHLV